jgi:hypothetical protein
MNLVSLLILLLTFCQFMLASDFKTYSEQDSIWSHIYGTSLWNDQLSFVDSTADGGYVLCGFVGAGQTTNQDFWIIKTDVNGDSVWSNRFGGSSYEQARMLCQTSDGGYLLAGYTNSFPYPIRNMYFLKTDSNGDSLWSTVFGGASEDRPWWVTETLDGKYIGAGRSYSFGSGNFDIYVVKMDSNGDSLWSDTYGGTNDDGATCVLQLADSSYIVGGYTFSYGAGDADYFLMALDKNGDSLWFHTYGGAGEEAYHNVCPTIDGGYALCGHSFSFGPGNWDYWLVKTDANGDSLWSRTYGGTNIDECRYTIQEPDGCYLLMGYTQSFGSGNKDYWLIKTDADGNVLWSETYGGLSEDYGYCVAPRHGGGYVMIGYTSSYGGLQQGLMIGTGVFPSTPTDTIGVSLTRWDIKPWGVNGWGTRQW